MAGHKSRDGYQWTPEEGLQAGVPSLGVVKPASNLDKDADNLFDVIVIGGGYTGLTAIRDLTLAGHKVLLVEARDRVGGRSWSSNIGGYPFEMGGTWVHWHQPFIWRELFRYGMTTTVDVSPVKEGGVSQCTINMDSRQVSMDRDKEDRVSESGLRKMVNVDGQDARTVIPFPHDPHFNTAAVAHYDTMSLADRFVQIADDLTPLERTVLEAFLSITCGGSWEESSFFELLRWWALMGYSYTSFMELGLTYKLRHGQSSLSRSLFDEALATGNLAYTFDTPVASVADHGGWVEVQPRASTGRSRLRGRRVICTVPLNVLHKVAFVPPLPAAKLDASRLGHVNQVVKMHAEVADPAVRSLSAFSYPVGKLTYTFGDGTTPAGNTHLVAFGSSLGSEHHAQPEAGDFSETLAAWNRFGLPSDKIRRVVFHNWHKDEFAEGAWEWLRPGMSTKFLDPLRARHGNVLFASADWAMGWRGFLDGAIEDGGRVAKLVSDEVKAEGEGKGSPVPAGKL